MNVIKMISKKNCYIGQNRPEKRNNREVSAIPDTSLNMFYQAFSSA